MRLHLNLTTIPDAELAKVMTWSVCIMKRIMRNKTKSFTFLLFNSSRTYLLKQNL